MSDNILNLNSAANAFDELMLSIAVSSYAEAEGEALLCELAEIKNNADLQPPESERKQIARIIRRRNAGRNMRDAGKAALKLSRSVSLVFMVCFMAFSASFVVSAQVREMVYRLVLRHERQYTLVRLETVMESVVTEGIYTWENAYAPTKLPAGYHLEEVLDLISSNAVIYKNADGREITFWQFEDGNIQVDSEDADVVQTININGKDALLVVKNGLTSITWGEDAGALINILSEESTSVTIAVAESVIKL